MLLWAYLWLRDQQYIPQAHVTTFDTFNTFRYKNAEKHLLAINQKGCLLTY